jgi:hypothetical protein
MKAGSSRLTAGLLAPKGTALPLKEAYASPYLNPVLPGRGAGGGGPMRQLAAAERARVACRLEPDEYRRLRILAARRRVPAGALLREALRTFLTVNAGDCPCLRGERSELGGGAFGCCEDHR